MFWFFLVVRHNEGCLSETWILPSGETSCDAGKHEDRSYLSMYSEYSCLLRPRQLQDLGQCWLVLPRHIFETKNERRPPSGNLWWSLQSRDPFPTVHALPSSVLQSQKRVRKPSTTLYSKKSFGSNLQSTLVVIATWSAARTVDFVAITYQTYHVGSTTKGCVDWYSQPATIKPHCW